MNAGNARSSMQRVPQRAVRGRAASTVDPAQTAVRAQARPGRGASATATPVNAAEVARTDLPPSRGRTRTWSPCTHRRAGSRAQWCRHHRRPGDRQLPNVVRWRPLRRATSHLPLAQQLLPHAVPAAGHAGCLRSLPRRRHRRILIRPGLSGSEIGGASMRCTGSLQ